MKLTYGDYILSKKGIPSANQRRKMKGLKKQIISIFIIIADEMGPHVELISSPYTSDPLFNEREISILFSAVTMLEIDELIMGELKLIFEVSDFKMKDGRPSKKIIVAVCGCEANSQQVRTMVKNILQSSENAIKNLENFYER